MGEASNTSFKVEFRKFGETVSVRGIPKILKSNARFLKMFWLVSVLASSCILLWQLSAVFIRYYGYPVTTTFTNAKDHPLFPDVTVCNLYPFGSIINSQLTWQTYVNLMADAKKNITFEEIQSMAKYNMSLDDYEEIWAALLSPSVYFSNFPIHSDTDDETLPSIFPDCKYFNWDLTESDVKCVDNVKTVFNSNYFRCYTLHLNDTVVQTVKGLALMIYLNNFPDITDDLFEFDLSKSNAFGVRFIIHTPGTEPQIEDGLNIGPGTETTLRIVPTRRERLDKPYSQQGCTSQKYIDGSQDLYTMDGCVNVCIQQHIVDQCGCISYLYKFTDAQLESVDGMFCSNLSLLVDKHILPADKVGILSYICSFYARIDIDACSGKCQLPCKERYYDYTYDVAPWPHVSHQLAFYRAFIYGNPVYGKRFDVYSPIDEAEEQGNVTQTNVINDFNKLDLIENNFMRVNVIQKFSSPYVMTDQPQITLEAMLSAIGGTLSLWLGITVMTLVEVAEFVYNLVMLFCEKKRKTKGSSVDTTA